MQKVIRQKDISLPAFYDLGDTATASNTAWNTASSDNSNAEMGDVAAVRDLGDVVLADLGSNVARQVIRRVAFPAKDSLHSPQCSNTLFTKPSQAQGQQGKRCVDEQQLLMSRAAVWEKSQQAALATDIECVSCADYDDKAKDCAPAANNDEFVPLLRKQCSYQRGNAQEGPHSNHGRTTVVCDSCVASQPVSFQEDPKMRGAWGITPTHCHSSCGTCLPGNSDSTACTSCRAEPKRDPKNKFHGCRVRKHAISLS